MQWLLRLFAVYLLALSGIACNASDGCCQEEQPASIGNAFIAATHLPSEQEKTNFPCSPFFACGASQGIVLPEAQLAVVVPVTCCRTHRGTEPKMILSVFVNDNWQPPKTV